MDVETARMVVRTVRDVLGDCETWSSMTRTRGAAVIVDVIASDDDDRLVIESRNSLGGSTYTSFTIKDTELRRALVRLLQPGTTLKEALKLGI